MKSDDHPPCRVHMVGNAHIDPMWIWDWREGMHEVLQTFRSAVDRLDEEGGRRSSFHGSPSRPFSPSWLPATGRST